MSRYQKEREKQGWHHHDDDGDGVDDDGDGVYVDVVVFSSWWRAVCDVCMSPLGADHSVLMSQAGYKVI